jgi:IS30 family transposase
MEHNNNTTKSSNSQAKRLSFNHLNHTKRRNIEALLKQNLTQTEIARRLGVHRSTISREIKRGLHRKGANATGTIYEYCFDVAERIAKENRARCCTLPKLSADSPKIKQLSLIINREHISLQTALHLFEEYFGVKFPVSLKTVYKYVRTGMIMPKHKMRIKMAVTPKEPKTAKSIQRGSNISERPQEAQNRAEFGHFEGDLIVGKKGTKHCILTLVDRLSRLLFAFRIKDKSAASVLEVFNTLETRLGTDNFRRTFKSITFDNGKEFADFQRLETSHIATDTLRTKVYYANPYHSWERGTNENTNRWVRYYFPKKTDFSDISDKALAQAVNKINFSVRTILANKSAYKFITTYDTNIISILDTIGITNPFTKMNRYLSAIQN